MDGGIPLVEFHSAGGGGDGQQVKFFFWKSGKVFLRIKLKFGKKLRILLRLLLG